jgi:DNA processing protein
MSSCRPKDLIVLKKIPGVGPYRLRALVQHFQEIDAIRSATAPQLIRAEGMDRRTAVAVTRFFRGRGLAEAEKAAEEQCRRVVRAGGRIITLWDEEYPRNLSGIYDPPALLFVRGTLVESDAVSLAVVGTRVPSLYGTGIAERFSGELAAHGITVVSGLARGIDTAAHTATLRENGRTIAVLGSGLDVIYPPENRSLAGKIAEQGALVTEFEMGTRPDAVNFPQRNRIVSGMSLGTLVAETAVNGGAMITAAMALEQNREVFAVPSPLSPGKVSGTNRLIKEGKALLIESVADILGALGAPLATMRPGRPGAGRELSSDLSLFERRLFDLLEESPQHIDLLAERSGMSASEVMVHLLSLEFKGAARQLAGKRFVRR